MSSHENCPCMEECPLNRALKLIGGKWKMQILCSLHNNGPTRYNQLKRTLDGVSNTVLAGALRELEADGLAVGGRTAGRTVTEDRSIIQSARETRARAAVRACLELPLRYTINMLVTRSGSN